MDPTQSQAMETFMSVTGSSRAAAFQRLQAHGWDLNVAIDAFFNDGEDSRLQQQTDAGWDDWMEEDEPPHHIEPTHSLAPQPINQNIPSFGNLEPELLQHSGMGGLSARGTAPVIWHPREVREVPVDWKDDGASVRPHPGLVIEEVPPTEVNVLALESQRHVIVEDDDDSPSTASSVFKGSLERTDRNSEMNAEHGSSQYLNRPNVPFVEGPGFRNDDGLDIEEEMLLVAIEASRKEAEAASRRPNYSESLNAEEDDLAMAVSLSIQTAEREKALRELENTTGQQEGIMQDDYDRKSTPLGNKNIDSLNRNGSSVVDNTKIGQEGRDKALPNGEANMGIQESSLNIVSSNVIEETEEHEEQPLLRRSNRRSTASAPLLGSGSELYRQESDRSHLESGRSSYMPENKYNSTTPPQTTGHTSSNDEWGGISSEEHEEAVMLEAMFGTLPENEVARFGLPAIHSDSNAVLPDAPEGYTHSFQPPSPSIIVERLLREQQDNEYRASLKADREKERKALLEAADRRMEEAKAVASAEAEERLRSQEEQSRIHAEKELERIIAAKKSSLPSEPAMEDENAVTVLVRMPDGSRHGRRFRKSEKLQCLFDFIDVGGVVNPGSYRLVRQYPRQAFTNVEHGLSFSDLGLNSKLEALFLELI